MKMIQFSIWYIIAVLVITSDAQSSCVDTVDVRQKGTNSAATSTQVIVPRSAFSCNGRITGYLISLESASSSGDYPIVQVWHPTSSTVYTRVATECSLTDNDISEMSNGDYHLGNVSCTGDNRIEFQSGDVIGYYHANEVWYRLWNIGTMRYTSYIRDENSPPNMFNINNVDNSETRQPLIQVVYDIRCDNLSTLANGEITSCSSGRVGVGYEGDTCSFTCNTGYELTGSDTRTCQSNGSWSGSDDVCRRDIPISSSNGSSTDGRVIIGGTMGGVILLLMIITVTVTLCIVILCIKRCYRKKAASSSDDRVSYSVTKLNIDVPIEHNPSYDVIKMDNSTIKPESSDVPVTTNPSYSVFTKPYSKDESNNAPQSLKTKAYPVDKNSLKDIVELESKAKLIVVTHDASEAIMKIDQDDFDCVRPIEPAVPHHNTKSEATIKMDVNPSYGLTANISDVKPSDYDYMLDHTIKHPKINSTPAEYLTLYPDAAIKMDVNPSYSLAMQVLNTNEAGVKSDYDYVDDGSIHHPSHHHAMNTDQQRSAKIIGNAQAQHLPNNVEVKHNFDYLDNGPLNHEAMGGGHRRFPLLTMKQDSTQITGQNSDLYYDAVIQPSLSADSIEDGGVNQSKSEVLNKSITKIIEDDYVYGPVNQPMSDVVQVEEDI